MGSHEQDTIDFSLAARFSEKFFSPWPVRMQVEFGAATHVGKVRSNNEDHFVVVKRRRLHELLLTNLSPNDVTLTDDVAYGMVVADGMGGANFGELASRLALQRMFELSQQATSWVMKCTDIDAQQIRQRVEAYAQEIQTTIREQATENPALAGMGTTWTSAHLLLPHVVIVHLGDSRAYLIRHGALSQITRDDTVAQAYLDAGVHPETAKKFRHMLLNSFGGGQDDVTAQIHLLEVEPGDRLLLCTDGLTDMVSDNQIAVLLERHKSPQAACDALLQAALEVGGKDNITVVLASTASESFKKACNTTGPFGRFIRKEFSDAEVYEHPHVAARCDEARTGQSARPGGQERSGD
jgi:protein phosphatase